MSVQVILQEDFPLLGYVGDMVTVKPGYARNFLVPRGIAVPAASANGRLLKHRIEGIQAKRAKLKAQAQEFGTRLQGANLEFTLKVGEHGKIFGAVTAKDIEAQFKTKGFDINKKQIRLAEPLKAQGAFRVEIKVHSEVAILVPVTVRLEGEKHPDGDKAAQSADAGNRDKKKDSKKRAPRKKKSEEGTTEENTSKE